MSDQNSLGLERLTLWKCYFPHPKTGIPKDQHAHTAGACIQSCYVFPCLRGGGRNPFFYAPRPCFPKHSKDSNWPFSYRVTVLFWPLNSISHEPSIPELVFQVGWPHGKSLSGETSGCLFRLPSRRVRSRFNSYWYNPQLWMNISFLQMSWKCSEVGLARWCWWNCIWV